MKLTLPYPPSVNHMWRTVKGRTMLSAEGRRYRTQVSLLWVAAWGSGFDAERLKISMVAWMPDKRRRDLDNMFKAVLDGLAFVGVYDDDSQIDDLQIIRGGVDRGNPRVEVEINNA